MIVWPIYVQEVPINTKFSECQCILVFLTPASMKTVIISQIRS